MQTAINDLIRIRFDRKYDEQQLHINGRSSTTNGTSSESPAPGQKRPAEDDISEFSSGPAASSKAMPRKKQARAVDEDAAFAARLQAEENRQARSTRGGNNPKKPPVSKRKVVKRKKKSSTKIKGEDGSELDSDADVSEKKINRNSAFHVCRTPLSCHTNSLGLLGPLLNESLTQKPLLLSAPLSALLSNEVQLSRPQTVKRIWGYVHDHGLQDQADKRMIICDGPMRAVFKSDKIHMFTMNKILSQNLYPVDE